MVSNVVWMREWDYQQENGVEVRGGGDVARYEDVEDPVDDKEDK